MKICSQASQTPTSNDDANASQLLFIMVIFVCFLQHVEGLAKLQSEARRYLLAVLSASWNQVF